MESTALSLLFLLLLRLTAVTRSYNCIHGTVKNEVTDTCHPEQRGGLLPPSRTAPAHLSPSHPSS